MTSAGAVGKRRWKHAALAHHDEDPLETQRKAARRDALP